MSAPDELRKYHDTSVLQTRKCLYDVAQGTTLQERIVAELACSHGMRVLDIGCGFGEILMRLHDESDIAGVGLDPSEPQIQQAQTDTKGRPLRFETADFLQWKTDEMFDRIMINHVLHLVDDKGAFIEKAFALLKPGGRLLVSLHSDNTQPKQKTWTAWMENEYPVVHSQKQRSISLERDSRIFDNLPGDIHRLYHEQTIVLTDSQPYIDYLNTVRHRWIPEPTDEQWNAYLDHVRAAIVGEITKNGSFTEPSVNGLVILDRS